MVLLIIIISLSFAAGAIALPGLTRATTEFVQNYRAYFMRRIGPGLRNSHVTFDLTILFIGSLVLIVCLSIAGFLLLGFIGLFAGLILGMLVPRTLLKRLRQKREEKFIQQLPDALHALSASLRSGANLTRGLEQLASWQPAPLRQEFAQVLTEYQIGRDLGESLENLHVRIDKPEVELTTSAINISRQVGGNLADTLESLAETLAEKITIEGKITALTAMGRMQGWVVTAVPLLMGLAMYLTNPEQIMPLFTETGGWVILVIIFIMMTLAVLTIRKIVNIDV